MAVSHFSTAATSGGVGCCCCCCCGRFCPWLLLRLHLQTVRCGQQLAPTHVHVAGTAAAAAAAAAIVRVPWRVL